jgi:hypothetical protein
MRRTTITAVCTALALLAPGLAVASSGPSSSAAAAIVDCQAHNKLTRSYTTSALENALATLPATVREYSDCVDAIHTQLLSQSGTRTGKDSGSGGSGGSFLPTPVIIVLVILVLAAVTFGALEVRRRRGD